MASPEARVLLMFHDLDLEAPDKKGECYDYVEVLTEDNQDSAEKFCGSRLRQTEAEPIISVGNKLSVNFHSDASIGGKGFKSSVWEGMMADSEINITD